MTVDLRSVDKQPVNEWFKASRNSSEPSLVFVVANTIFVRREECHIDKSVKSEDFTGSRD